jgi:hypothetical protein
MKISRVLDFCERIRFSVRLLLVFHDAQAVNIRLWFQLIKGRPAEQTVISVKLPVQWVHAYPKSVLDVFAFMLGVDWDSRCQILIIFSVSNLLKSQPGLRTIDVP